MFNVAWVERGSDSRIIAAGSGKVVPPLCEQVESYEKALEMLHADNPQPKILSPLDFIKKFTTQERVAIRSNTDPYVQDFQRMLDLAKEVRLDDPGTIEGIGYLVQSELISQDRADEILEVKK